MTVESNRIARAFNTSDVTPAVMLDILKAFNLWKIGPYFSMGHLHKSVIFILLFLGTPGLLGSDGVICVIAIYDDDAILYSKCDRDSNSWQKWQQLS